MKINHSTFVFTCRYINDLTCIFNFTYKYLFTYVGVFCVLELLSLSNVVDILHITYVEATFTIYHTFAGSFQFRQTLALQHYNNDFVSDRNLSLSAFLGFWYDYFFSHDLENRVFKIFKVDGKSRFPKLINRYQFEKVKRRNQWNMYSVWNFWFEISGSRCLVFTTTTELRTPTIKGGTQLNWGKQKYEVTLWNSRPTFRFKCSPN